MQDARAAERKKLAILQAAGYRYDIDSQLYVNRSAKKAFSVPFIDDNSVDDIARMIQEQSTAPEWRFFFVQEPSVTVREQLVNMLS
jgi:hypothetical protein